jgi:hypothetical protein
LPRPPKPSAALVLSYHTRQGPVAARRGAYVLELLDIDGWPILIYIRLAYLLGLQYMAEARQSAFS